MHGHTHQGHVLAAAVAVAVQKIILENDLVSNVRTMGALLEKGLRERIGNHPNVGDIRGRGLFWGIEFVQDKLTKEPFPADQQVASKINDLGLTEAFSIVVYPGSGTVDGVHGDHIILAPPYNVTAVDIELVVSTVAALIEDFFAARPVHEGQSG